jgi:hypothetical protein
VFDNKKRAAFVSRNSFASIRVYTSMFLNVVAVYREYMQVFGGASIGHTDPWSVWEAFESKLSMQTIGEDLALAAQSRSRICG